jgi:uncharacterized protein YeaO (DUF488 family)
LASLANKTLDEAQAPMAYKITIKRCYESPSLTDGARVLVDGLWPRGGRKEAIRLAGWVRKVAPSQKLRKQRHIISKAWTKKDSR